MYNLIIMIWKVILLALKKTAAQIAKSKASKVVGKTVLSNMKRHLVSKSGTSKIVRDVGYINKFWKSADKKGFIIERIANQNRFTRNMWRQYNKTLTEDWKKTFGLAKRQIENEQIKMENDMVKFFKTKEGLDQFEFQLFREFYKNKLSDIQKKWFNNIMGEELQVYFNSTYIDFGIFIPYGKNKQRGIMGLQLYDTTSKRNPSLYYQWVRVKTKDWKRITEDPTGTNFWKKWYAKNRYNPNNITSSSIYNTPEYRRKWRQEHQRKVNNNAKTN